KKGEAGPVESTVIAAWKPRPENRGVVNLTQDGTLHERHENCQSAASAHDRGHGCTQAQPAHSAQPHFELQAVRRLAEAFARYSDARRGAPFPTAPHRERSEHLQPRPDHDRGAVFVPRHTASPRSGG